MSERLFFDETPEQGIQRIWHRDDDDIVIETQQDVTALVAGNKRMYNGVDERARFNPVNSASTLGTGLVARIPTALYQQLVAAGIWDDEARKAAWLNDPAHAHFRTRPGRI